MKLKIEIEDDCIEALDYQLDRIKQQIRQGFTVGFGWDLSEQMESG